MNLDSYIKELIKSGYANSTINTKERHLSVFKDFLRESGLTLDNFNKKDLKKFSRFLEKRKISKKSIRSYLNTARLALNRLQVGDFKEEEEETDIQKLVNYYFETKGYTVDDIKRDAKKKKIIYSRHTKPAKDLIELSGSLYRAKQAILRVSQWATSRNLDYAIETVIKKWPEINKLKPKEKKKKAYYRGDPMIWSENKKKWYVISKSGDWLEFAGDKDDIEWKEE